MNLNVRLKEIHENLNDYFYINKAIPLIDKNEMNFVLDIEASPNHDKTEAITYNTAIMSCDNNSDIAFNYTHIEGVLNVLLNMNTEKVNIYVHNLLYDIKPFITKFIEIYGNNPVKQELYDIEMYNPFEKEYQKIKKQRVKYNDTKENYQYSMFLKKGQLYGCTLYGKSITTKLGIKKPREIVFHDTFKLLPYSLQKCCDSFLDLQLPKDGLDYEKVRQIGDLLNEDEKKYIYNDVYGLKYLVQKLVIDGFETNGKHVQYKKLTNSSQSLYDYKLSLYEDYQKRQNAFKNENVMDLTFNLPSRFHTYSDKNLDRKLDMLFQCIFPVDSTFTDGWLRHSYYGGLSKVDYKNVEKFSKYKVKRGITLDVNSLYPFQMLDKLLPFGTPYYYEQPYKELQPHIREQFPLYVQQIKIYDMKIKKGKMSFVQVKDREDFNGRDTIEENINKYGEKTPITLFLCNPLLDLLFECYDVLNYELLSCMCFRGAMDLFKNYLDFWGNVKKTSKGGAREVAKLRQNALYGKFGATGDNEISKLKIIEGKFTVQKEKDIFYSDTIYLGIATFITSYAKVQLIKAINDNIDRFMYCDTDSMHLFGTVDQVKGIKIHDKEYGAWSIECEFSDFKYIGAKRYAELVILTNSKSVKLHNFYLVDKWEIKCCGLSDKIMKKVDDISVFTECKYSSKEIKKMKLYTRENDIYYYEDKNFTKKVKGLFKSSKSKIVKGGTLILETPYLLSANKFYR